MSLEVTASKNIAKGISSKNPIPPRRKGFKTSSGKVRKQVLEGEVIEPTPTTPIQAEPEVYDADLVAGRLTTGQRQLDAPAPRMITSTRITPIPALPAPAGKGSKKGKSKAKGKELPRQFRGRDGKA